MCCIIHNSFTSPDSLETSITKDLGVVTNPQPHWYRQPTRHQQAETDMRKLCACNNTHNSSTPANSWLTAQAAVLSSCSCPTYLRLLHPLQDWHACPPPAAAQHVDVSKTVTNSDLLFTKQKSRLRRFMLVSGTRWASPQSPCPVRRKAIRTQLW